MPNTSDADPTVKLYSWSSNPRSWNQTAMPTNGPTS